MSIHDVWSHSRDVAEEKCRFTSGKRYLEVVFTSEKIGGVKDKYLFRAAETAGDTGASYLI